MVKINKREENMTKKIDMPFGLPWTAIISEDELHTLQNAVTIVAREKARAKMEGYE